MLSVVVMWMKYFSLIPDFFFSYQNNSGQMRFRVTTLSRRWVAGPGSIQVSFRLLAFDSFNLILFMSIINTTTKQFIWICQRLKLWNWFIKNGLGNDLLNCLLYVTISAYGGLMFHDMIYQVLSTLFSWCYKILSFVCYSFIVLVISGILWCFILVMSKMF